ncbi:MAG: radical SAM protein [Mariniphaga sp.]|nr:radical SAM protein [Mariniphaga sp.]
MEEGSLITYKNLSGPIAVQLELTPRCNNVCNYCYNSWRGNKDSEKELDLKEYMAIAKKLVKDEVFEVVLTGGEPLLRKDIVYPLADYFSKNGLKVGLNTNLTLLTQEDCDKIKDSNITRILGSLSSFDKEIYNKITQTKNYERALDGIELLVRNNIALGINMVVKQENKHQVYDTGKFVFGLGVNVFCGTPATPSEFLNSKEELTPKEIINTLDDLLRLKKEYGMFVDILEPLPRCIFKDAEKYEPFLKRDCGAGKITAVISSSGDVKPCTHVPKKYGNLLEKDLSEIWENMGEWRDGSFMPRECGNCNENSYCSMGCRESSKLKTNKYNNLDPWSDPDNIGERKVQSESIVVLPDETYRIYSNLMFRDELGGKLIYSPKTMTLGLINNDFFNFLTKLHKEKNFKVRDVLQEYGENSINLIKYLKSKTFIKKIREG